jgi:tRNA threonylcarbamoyladenosine biosynthesis protein TsaB
MIVLGFDTATPATAVGLMLDDGSVREERDDPQQGECPGHSTRLLALAHDLLTDVGLRWREIERIAVGVGPGTFTGLRIGVATAHGLAQSTGAQLCGVSSLAALAEGVDGEAKGVLAVIDARRGEVFAAAYGAADAAAGATDERSRLAGPSVLAPERLSEVLEEARVAKRDGWLAVGDGAVRYRASLADLGLSVPGDGSPLHQVSGRAICELGAQVAVASDHVLPDYRRRPDAELTPKGGSPLAAGGTSPSAANEASPPVLKGGR